VLRPVAAFGEYQFTITNGTGEAERIRGAAVTANFFETLGRSPIRGRAFSGEEEGPRREHVAILGYGLWQRRYGGDPTIVGGPSRPRKARRRRGDAAGLRLPQPCRGVDSARDNPTSTDCWCYRAISRPAPRRRRAPARWPGWPTLRASGRPARDPKAKDPKAIVIAQPLARTLVGDVRGPLLILLCAVGTVPHRLRERRQPAAGARQRPHCERARAPRRQPVAYRPSAVRRESLPPRRIDPGWSPRSSRARAAGRQRPRTSTPRRSTIRAAFTVAVTAHRVLGADSVRGARIDLHDVVRDGWRATRSGRPAAGGRLRGGTVRPSVVLLVVAA
jgi:hypothetical protein